MSWRLCIDLYFFEQNSCFPDENKRETAGLNYFLAEESSLSFKLHYLGKLHRLKFGEISSRPLQRKRGGTSNEGCISISIFSNRIRAFLMGTNVIQQVSFISWQGKRFVPRNAIFPEYCSDWCLGETTSRSFRRNGGCSKLNEGCILIYISLNRIRISLIRSNVILQVSAISWQEKRFVPRNFIVPEYCSVWLPDETSSRPFRKNRGFSLFLESSMSISIFRNRSHVFLIGSNVILLV